MKASIVALFVAFTLAGCAPTGPLTAPPGVSQYQVDNDVARCKFEASRRDGVAWPDEVHQCLVAKGYR